MLASKTRPLKTLAGSWIQACSPQPRIQRFRYGSPSPSSAPRFVVSEIASGHVITHAAARYTTAAPIHEDLICLAGFQSSKVPEFHGASSTVPSNSHTLELWNTRTLELWNPGTLEPL